MTHQESALKLLHSGTVIPAIPLALTEDRKLDEAHQRLMVRYYLEAGGGGGTQHPVRNPGSEIQPLPPGAGAGGLGDRRL